MSKRHFLMDPSQLSTSKQSKLSQSTNWDVCVLCQVATDESLQCPLRSTKPTIGSGYASLAEDLLRFQTLQHMPLDLSLERLNDGDGIESTLKAHRAQWHKKCRLKFNKKMFDEHSRADLTIEQQHSNSVVHTRSADCHSQSTNSTCFFCNEPAGSADLHKASTYNIDANVRQCAIELEDTALLAKLAAGDMIAIEAMYHKNCLALLYKRLDKARHAANESSEGDDSRLHGIAFAELVAFIEDMNSDEDSAPVFKLTDIAELYKVRLQQLGVTVQKRIHTTRLKNRLLSAIPGLRAHSQGRDALLSFEKHIGPALMKACDHDSDAVHLMRAAQIVRKEIFDSGFFFDGSFPANCQQKAVPPSLLALVNMILDGANIKHQNQVVSTNTTKPALAISQLIVFNSTKHARNVDSSSSARHSRSRETPLPLYLSFKIHAVTRNKGLIDTLFSLGLCVSYDRLLQLTSDIANSVCRHYSLEDVVCPPKLHRGLFTTAAVDNIDHNPSSTTAKDSFHGTGISLIQHPSHTHDGSDRGIPVINQAGSSTKSVTPLPPAYTVVPPAALKSKDFNAPIVQGPVRPPNLLAAAAAVEDEYVWLSKVKTALEKPTADGWISWSAYHADVQQAVIPPAAISALLPLFLDNAHSVAMIRHSMDVVKAAVQYLNPGQMPIIALDQPLYALAKEVQWTWPATYGEDHFVIMFGGLHIEMAMLKLLGGWLEDSGWTNALVQADIATSGTANSFIHASHVTKTRHAHQVTAASLYTLLQRAHSDTDAVQADSPPFEEWCTQRSKASVHFDYWLKTLSLELLLLRYIRSIREGNFQLYVESLTQIMPWMFALDHTHYSRWLSVHIRDMMSLAEKHPHVLAEFQSGNFVVHKTSNKFSAMALDQSHEQNNAMVKGCGGAIGLTDNPGALQRWMVAGPEISRITTEFEEQAMKQHDSTGDTGHRHHDQQPGVQAAFLKKVKTLVTVLEEMGNPFLEPSADLLVINTRDIMDTQVAETVRMIEKLGEEQYTKFVTERLEKCTTPVTQTIPKNKLPLFSRPPLKIKSKQKTQLAAIKSDCALFSRLYIACQTRDGDIDSFFFHENQAAPPALSTGGRMRIGVKADLLRCLELDFPQSNSAPVVDATVLDGAAVVQMLNPGTSRTFQEYGQRVFAPYISALLEKSNRTDIVWDVYLPTSLKASTRERRGKGTRKRVAPSTLMPKNWKQFLRDDENKTELFAFLSREAVHLPLTEGKELYATDGREVLCSPAESYLASVAPCSHEEADTRLLLHVADAVQKGCKKVTIRTVDTDVVILAVASFSKIAPDELWIAFGVGSSFRYIAVHEMVAAMNQTQCLTLPVFHAFTGCDTVSAFAGRGKKTAWETWKSFPEVNDAFSELLTMPSEVSERSMSLLERFVVLMYDRTSDSMQVNDARKQLFTQKSRTLENIPPTQAALQQHIKRACYQANCWNQALAKDPQMPEPSDWGWTKDTTRWQPLWTTLPEASKSCHELIHCSCQKGCTGRCKCAKAALKCTALCFCSGDC